MKKNYLTKMLTAAFCVLFAAQAFGQISNGNPVARTIRTGNRPVKGDWGLFVGPSYNEIRDLLDKNSDIDTWYGLPLVNIKYFLGDKTEFRTGIQLCSKSYKTKGDILDDKDYLEKERDAYYRLSPGIARHFSPTNILDVYIGAALPFGVTVDNYVSKYDGKTAPYTGIHKRTSFEVGFQAFIGLQCFVADLPVAIGLEYGFSGMKYFGQKVKNTVLDGEGSEQTFYTTLDDPTTPYSKVKCSEGYFGSDVRITLSYYFNK